MASEQTTLSDVGRSVRVLDLDLGDDPHMDHLDGVRVEEVEPIGAVFRVRVAGDRDWHYVTREEISPPPPKERPYADVNDAEKQARASGATPDERA